MKKRLKNLFSKQVISGVLSTVMTFNMTSFFPRDTFALEETIESYIDDLNKVTVNRQLMSNGYLAMNVFDNGHFSFGTTGGNPDNPKDDDKHVLYGFS